MKPNILFIVVDSLRFDKFYGINKTSLTPNIDLLIKNGAYFSQSISSADGTYVSLSSIFTGQHPFNHGVTWFKNHPNATKLLQIIKENNYNLYATVPDHPYFHTLTANFDAKSIVSGKPYLRLFEGYGQTILDMFSKMRSSWFYYIHIMDLHVTKKLPIEFSDEKYGLDSFDKRLSIIDMWIGKFLQFVNLQNTIVVVTSDHGEFDSDLDVDLGSIPTLENFLRKIKSISPKFIEPLGIRFFVLIREIVRNRRTKGLQKNMSDDELRKLMTRGSDNLFDQSLRVPLLFTGFKITPSFINQQVRQIDIFPSIFEIIGDLSVKDIDGTSLLPLMQGKKLEELPAYFESVSKINQELGNSIGIRTSHYKYFRSRNALKKNAFLFDLRRDPNERKNLADEIPDVIDDMENILTKIKNKTYRIKNEEKMTQADINKAKSILRDLGYDK